MCDQQSVRSLWYIKGIIDVMEYLTKDLAEGDAVKHKYPRSWMGISRDRLIEVREWLST